MVCTGALAREEMSREVYFEVYLSNKVKIGETVPAQHFVAHLEDGAGGVLSLLRTMHRGLLLAQGGRFAAGGREPMPLGLSGGDGRGGEPGGEVGLGAVGVGLVAVAAAAAAAAGVVERGEEAEVDVHRLEGLRLGAAGDVA